MGVLDGQPVSAAITNPAFINKNQDDTMGNILGFTRALSGATVADIQAAVNKLYTATGASESQTGTVYSAPTNTISDGDSHQTALGKLARKFDPATGHQHTGAAGDAPPISGGFITNVPYEQFVVAAGTLSAVTGSSYNVTSVLTGKSPSSSSTTLGVVVNTPYNRTFLANGTTPSLTDCFIDSTGNLVYGRLTESAGTWTLSFYSLVAGTETAYTFTSATDITWYYRELYRPLVATPVYEPNYLEFEFKNVHSVASTGGNALYGDVVFAATAGVSVSQSGQVITFVGALSDTYPQDVGATGYAGVGDRSSRYDHVHQGVHSVAASGSTALYADVIFQAASGVTISEAGQNILFTADFYENAQSVGVANLSGTSLQVSHGDHVHQGVHSIAASGSPALYGDVVLQAASGVIALETGQNILFYADEYTSTPAPIAAAGSAGSSLQVSKGDHTHAGVHSITASGYPPVLGDATLLAGTGMTISSTGNIIEFISSPGTTIAASGYAPLTGNVILAGSGGVTVSESGQVIYISAASGGGGTASPLTTKGDLYGYDTTNARVPAGTGGQYLITDPNATLGVRYQDQNPKNYVVNNDAEILATTGWATYADAAQNIPVNGTGGTATGLTFSAATGSPLAGSASFLITQANSTSLQGKGVSYDFTIDSEDQANLLTISFNYNADSNFTASDGVTTPLNDGTTSTNAGNSDIEVFVYDVTNAVLIPVNPEVITAKGTANFKFKGVFQTASNSTSYRLILHAATTSAPATGYNFKFDNMFCGPNSGASFVTGRAPTVQRFLSGSGTYTLPNPKPLYIKVTMCGPGGGGQGGATPNNNGSSGSNGSGATTFGSSLLTANNGTGATGAGTSGWGQGGTVTVSSPAISVVANKGGTGGGGVSTTTGSADANGNTPGGSNSFGGGGNPAIANSGQGGAGGAGFQAFGNGSGSSGGAGGYIEAIIPNPSSTYAYAIGTGGAGGAGQGSGEAGGAGADGIVIVEEFYSPFGDLNGGDGRLVAMQYTNAGGTTVNNTAGGNVIPYGTVVYDTHSAYNTSTGKYLVPISGVYHVSAGFLTAAFSLSGTQFVKIYLYKNSSVIKQIQTWGNGNSQSWGIELGSDVYATAGDTLEVRSFADSGGTTTQTSATDYNRISIHKVENGNANDADVTVTASYYRSSGQSIPNTTATVITWNTKLTDSHSGMNTSTGVYTIPIPGVYLVTSQLDVDPNATGRRQFTVQKNASDIRIFRNDAGTSAVTSVLNGSLEERFVAGDLIGVYLFQDSGGSLTVASNGANFANFSINRIGN